MPASYPTAVKSFTTKNADDTIQASHINDLQDEVAAIESGLLLGTGAWVAGASTLASLSVTGGSTLAKLHVSGASTLASVGVTGAATAGSLSVSGGSTLATLSVSGASTFASVEVTGGSTLASAQVTGNCTISGTLTAKTIVSTSIPTIAGVTSYVRAYLGTVQQVSSAAGQVIAFESKDADLLSEYSTTTYTFTPQAAGYYQVAARCLSTTAYDKSYTLGIYVNGTVAIEAAGQGASAPLTVAANGILALSSGSSGAVTARIYHNWSTARLSTGLGITSFEILRIF